MLCKPKKKAQCHVTYIKILVVLLLPIVYIIQISYGAQLIDSDRYPYFYATVPTDDFLTRVRLELLNDFQWTRVALLAIDELDYITVR